MDSAIVTLKAISRDVAGACNPSLDLDNRATAGWWLTELHEATAVLAAYAVIVAIGVAVWAMTPPKAKAAAPKRSSGPLSWAEVGARFSSSPVMTTLKIVYNLTQVILCVWMVAYALINAGRAGYFKHYEEQGSLCLKSSIFPGAARTEAEDNLTFVLWVFYLSKVLDFADTVFIVLQGNWQQFTFLHIFHHFSIFAFYWLNIFAGYDGDIWFTIVANGTIHAIMYYYYTLTTLGAKPWWKPLVTYAQMLQFLAMMTQAAFLYADPDCGYPRLIAACYFFYILFLFVLFAQFAAGAYCRAPSRKQKAE